MDEARVGGEAGNSKGKGREPRSKASAVFRAPAREEMKSRIMHWTHLLGQMAFVGSGSQGVHGKAKLWGLRSELCERSSRCWYS